MTEFNNSPNQEGNDGDDGNYSQNQYNKTPEYSFWAEQIPSNSNPYQNQGADQWQVSNTSPNMNQDQTNHNSNPKKESGSGGKVMKFIVKSVCFGLIAAVSFIGLQKAINVVFPDASIVSIVDTVEGKAANQHYEVSYTKDATVKTADRSAITEVANDTLPAVVSISSSSTQTVRDWFGQQYSQDQESRGSGIIINKTDQELLIATNNHVVEGANTISVTFKDGSTADAIIKGTDATADLAVVTVDISQLKDDTLSAIAVAKLGDSDSVKVGEMAIAIGNALGYGQSVTVGYISAKDREVQITDGNTTKTMTFLQTDAAINPGNSGGALLNMKGEVIGINTVKYASDEIEGMGYAIPISTATPIINELMSREVLSEDEQGFLGITGTPVTEEASSYYNIPVGVYIRDVVQGAAADAAGLKAEDIITKVNDVEITSIMQLREYVNSLKVGTKVEVTYMRNTDGQYKEAIVTVTLGKNPDLNNSQEQ